MAKRTRYIWLAVITVLGGILALGAWHQSPGEDPDNQGGYGIVLVIFLILLCIYVPLAMRWIRARLHHQQAPESPSSER